MSLPLPDHIQGILFDVDGVLLESGREIEGASSTVAKMRKQGMKVGFLSNTTRKSKHAVIQNLREQNIEIESQELLTPSVIAADQLRRTQASALLFVAPETREDFNGIEESEIHPDFVVIGDLGAGFTPDVIQKAFSAIMGGARLMALQKNRYWKNESELLVDAGGYVALLEYVAQVESLVIGKPQRTFFVAALQRLGQAAEITAMVGDDIQNDVRAAMSLGLFGVQVETGKFRPQDLETPGPKPNLLVPSVRAL